MKIVIGCDHAALTLKDAVKAHLLELGHEVKDFGIYQAGEKCDYPEKAAEVARYLRDGNAERGILICGTGVGMAIAANKVKGIRACCCSDTFSARMTRAHNDANILTFGERVVGQGLAMELVDAFLTTEFEGGRHQRRVDLITKLEQEENSRFNLFSHNTTIADRITGGKNMSQTFEPQILNHPLIQHKISLMRKKETGSKDFRELASEVATLMCYEATRDLPLKEVTVETPICRCKTKMIAGRKLAIVPILRAGLGMVDGMLTLIPAAKVGHIGLYRDEETAKPIEYFCKLPCDISEREVIVVDPMLATGGSAIDAVSMIKKHGAANIKFMCIIAAPEGLAAFGKVHPDVKVYVGVLDEKLNDRNYIVPGLGDAGDRIFGTK